MIPHFDTMLEFVKSTSVKIEDVEYGRVDDKPLTGTLYTPKTIPEKPGPAVVYCHGGGFVGGTREHFEGHAAYLSQFGITGLCITYRLAPDCTFPGQIHDAKRALNYLKKNAQSLHIDPDKLVLCGSSAGGHIASYATATISDTQEEIEGIAKDAALSLKAAVFFCSVFSFGLPKIPVKKSTEKYLGGDLEEIPDIYQEASVLDKVNSSFPSTLLFHGDNDGTVRIEQSKGLVECLKEVGVPAKLIVEKGGNHKSYNFENEGFYTTLEQMKDFLVKELS